MINNVVMNEKKLFIQLLVEQAFQSEIIISNKEHLYSKYLTICSIRKHKPKTILQYSKTHLNRIHKREFPRK